MHVALLVVVCLLIALGVGLLVRGLRPVRRGDTPHCPTCEYNLTGLVSDKCPECGEPITPERIVRGERHRRPASAIAGLASLALSAILIAGAVGNVNWYRWSPTFLLIRQLELSQSNAAWTELDRRIRDNKLSDGQHSRLADVALKEQGAKTAGALRQSLLDYLGDRLLAGRLSDDQEKRFFEQLTEMLLAVRPRIAPGDPVTYRVSHRLKAPNMGIDCTIKTGEHVAIDGKTQPKRGSSSSGGSGCSSGSMTSSVSCDTVGRHKITVSPEVVVEAGGTEIHRRLVPLDAEFEVLAAEPADYIRRNSESPTAEQLRQAIAPEHFEWRQDGNNRKGVRYRLDGQLRLKTVPVNVAFDVIARVDGKEHRMGSIHAVRGYSTSWGVGAGEAELASPGSRVDIILRSSDKVARETVELYEIWDGELVYENVPCTLPVGHTIIQSPASSQASK